MWRTIPAGHAEPRRKPVICLGELLIDFVPLDTGDLQTAETFQKAAGGPPANVAVGLARLGVPADVDAEAVAAAAGLHFVEVISAARAV